MGNPPFGGRIHYTQGRVLDNTLLCRVLNGVVQFERGELDQFCIMLNGPGNRISVAPFPLAWRMERARDKPYSGDEYVR